MAKELINKKNVVFTYHEEHNYVYLNWIGFQREQEIYDAGEEILKVFKTLDCHKVLNDNREVIGPWNKAAEWTQNYWFPEMIKAGLQYFAWVFPDNVFAELSATKAMPDNEMVRKFLDEKTAESWLLSVSA